MASFKNKYRVFLRIITYTVIFCFLSQSYVQAQGPIQTTIQAPQTKLTDIAAHDLILDTMLPNVNDLQIPENMGKIQERYPGNHGKLIVHIQDSHAHYQAQQNCARILEWLAANSLNGGRKLLAVEGAAGPLTTKMFRNIPEEKIKQAVSDYFLKHAYINGAEYFTIFSQANVLLYGVEDEKLYRQNLAAFRQAQESKKDIWPYIKQLQQGAEGLIQNVYSGKLASWYQKVHDYHANKLSFSEYLKVLMERAGDIGYPNIKLIQQCMASEAELDMAKLEREREAVVRQLEKLMVKEELQEFVKKSLSFRSGQIDAKEYYEYLQFRISDCGLRINDYRNLKKYIELVKIYAKVKSKELFVECDRLEADIKNKVFSKPEQLQLDELLKGLRTVEHLVELKLNREELAYYKENKDELRLSKQAAVYNKIANQPKSAVQEFNYNIFEQFYKLAVKRDSALIDTTLRKMKAEGIKTAFLVTGGFHSEAIAEELEMQDISYVIASPFIDKPAREDTYLKLMMNVKTPFEQMLDAAGKRLANPAMVTVPLERSLDGLLGEGRDRRQAQLSLLSRLLDAAFLRKNAYKSKSAIMRAYTEMVAKRAGYMELTGFGQTRDNKLFYATYKTKLGLEYTMVVPLSQLKSTRLRKALRETNSSVAAEEKLTVAGEEISILFLVENTLELIWPLLEKGKRRVGPPVFQPKTEKGKKTPARAQTYLELRRQQEKAVRRQPPAVPVPVAEDDIVEVVEEVEEEDIISERLAAQRMFVLSLLAGLARIRKARGGILILVLLPLFTSGCDVLGMGYMTTMVLVGLVVLGTIIPADKKEKRTTLRLRFKRLLDLLIGREEPRVVEPVEEPVAVEKPDEEPVAEVAAEDKEVARVLAMAEEVEQRAAKRITEKAPRTIEEREEDNYIVEIAGVIEAIGRENGFLLFTKKYKVNDVEFQLGEVEQAFEAQFKKEHPEEYHQLEKIWQDKPQQQKVIALPVGVAIGAIEEEVTVYYGDLNAEELKVVLFWYQQWQEFLNRIKGNLAEMALSLRVRQPEEPTVAAEEITIEGAAASEALVPAPVTAMVLVRRQEISPVALTYAAALQLSPGAASLPEEKQAVLLPERTQTRQEDDEETRLLWEQLTGRVEEMTEMLIEDADLVEAANGFDLQVFAKKHRYRYRVLSGIAGENGSSWPGVEPVARLQLEKMQNKFQVLTHEQRVVVEDWYDKLHEYLVEQVQEEISGSVKASAVLRLKMKERLLLQAQEYFTEKFQREVPTAYALLAGIAAWPEVKFPVGLNLRILEQIGPLTGAEKQAMAEWYKYWIAYLQELAESFNRVGELMEVDRELRDKLKILAALRKEKDRKPAGYREALDLELAEIQVPEELTGFSDLAKLRQAEEECRILQGWLLITDNQIRELQGTQGGFQIEYKVLTGKIEAVRTEYGQLLQTLALSDSEEKYGMTIVDLEEALQARFRRSHPQEFRILRGISLWQQKKFEPNYYGNFRQLYQKMTSQEIEALWEWYRECEIYLEKIAEISSGLEVNTKFNNQLKTLNLLRQSQGREPLVLESLIARQAEMVAIPAEDAGIAEAEMIACLLKEMEIKQGMLSGLEGQLADFRQRREEADFGEFLAEKIRDINDIYLPIISLGGGYLRELGIDLAAMQLSFAAEFQQQSPLEYAILQGVESWQNEKVITGEPGEAIGERFRGLTFNEQNALLLWYTRWEQYLGEVTGRVDYLHKFLLPLDLEKELSLLGVHRRSGHYRQVVGRELEQIVVPADLANRPVEAKLWREEKRLAVCRRWQAIIREQLQELTMEADETAEKKFWVDLLAETSALSYLPEQVLDGLAAAVYQAFEEQFQREDVTAYTTLSGIAEWQEKKFITRELKPAEELFSEPLTGRQWLAARRWFRARQQHTEYLQTVLTAGERLAEAEEELIALFSKIEEFNLNNLVYDKEQMDIDLLQEQLTAAVTAAQADVPANIRDIPLAERAWLLERELAVKEQWLSENVFRKWKVT